MAWTLKIKEMVNVTNHSSASHGDQTQAFIVIPRIAINFIFTCVIKYLNIVHSSE